MPTPDVNLSIVIPCYNGASTIVDQLAALTPQLTDSSEVVVADNRSTDATREVVEGYARTVPQRIRVVPADARQGINHARNAGVRAAKGEFILLCDSDDVASPGWVEAMLRAFHDGADCVGGPLDRRDSDGRSFGVVAGVHARWWRLANKEIKSPTGANCGFKRGLFFDLGGFDESFAGGSDETEFFYRASLRGAKIVDVPTALMRYTLRARPREVIRQHFRYGECGVQLHQKLAPYGMPRDSILRALGVTMHSVIFVLVGSHRRRRLALERLSRRAGRLVGSIRRRHIYL